MVTVEDIVETKISKDTLRALAAFHSDPGNAVSLYFCAGHISETTHDQAKLAVKDLLREMRAEPVQDEPSRQFLDVVRQLEAIAEEIDSHPEHFHAIFACANESRRRIFDPAVSAPLYRLHRGRTFTLLPLLLALQELEPYAVVFLETGKARMFSVRGMEIEELALRLPDLSHAGHADDPRLGWSHHTERHERAHEMAYFHQLQQELHHLTLEHGFEQVAIGCREDLWGEIAGEFADMAKQIWMGRFHLPDFDMNTADVLIAAGPVVAQARAAFHNDLVQQVESSPARAALGTSDVLRSLEGGRARILLLDAIHGQQTIVECSTCGYRAVSDAPVCAACGSTDTFSVESSEALLREALAKHVEVVILHPLPPQFQGTAALLRY